MKIEDMEQTLELLNDINYFFKNIDEVNKKLQADLRNKQDEQEDLLHEIEFGKKNKLGIGERAKIYSMLEKVRIERRVIKDKIDLINTIKPYTNKYIIKGISAETEITIKKIETLKNNQETRQYTPRIIKDLKCAKKNKED